jgi:hypothetical protein
MIKQNMTNVTTSDFQSCERMAGAAGWGAAFTRLSVHGEGDMGCFLRIPVVREPKCHEWCGLVAACCVICHISD